MHFYVDRGLQYISRANTCLICKSYLTKKILRDRSRNNRVSINFYWESGQPKCKQRVDILPFPRVACENYASYVLHASVTCMCEPKKVTLSLDH